MYKARDSLRNLDYDLENILYRCNVHSDDIHKVVECRTGEHWIIFINSMTMQPEHMKILATNCRFKRFDFIKDGIITLRFTKE